MPVCGRLPYPLVKRLSALVHGGSLRGLYANDLKSAQKSRFCTLSLTHAPSTHDPRPPGCDTLGLWFPCMHCWDCWVQAGVCSLWAGWTLPYLSLLPCWSFFSRYSSPKYQWVKTRHRQCFWGKRQGQLTAPLFLSLFLPFSFFSDILPGLKRKLSPMMCLTADSFFSIPLSQFRSYNINPDKPIFIVKSPLPVGKAVPADPFLLWCTHSSQWPGLAWRLLKQPHWQLCIRTCPIALAWSLGSPDTLPRLQTLCLIGQKNTDVRQWDLGSRLLNHYGGTITAQILQIRNSHERFWSYFRSRISKIIVFNLVMENLGSGNLQRSMYMVPKLCISRPGQAKQQNLYNVRLE